MKRYLLLIEILVLLFTLISSTSAYTLSGYVFDSSGNPFGNVPIELGDEEETLWLDSITDEDGYFELTNLESGLYELYINEEGEGDCSIRNEVTECHDIGNEADCENSYAEYCSGDGYYYCDLSEGECGYFPCFWGDVGEGYGCYFTCDECMFGVNQSILEGYTSINFEDENIINMTDDLEINATLLKIDAKLELNSSVYKNGDAMKANVTVKNNEAFNLINWAAVFGVWGEGDEEEEELYFNLTPTILLAGQTKSYIFTYKILENNTYDKLGPFGGIGTFDFDVESSQGTMKALAYKVDEKDICIEDSDCDGIQDNVDNCPSHYNPHQGNTIYAYDNFNDNILSSNWTEWKPDPNIAIREINNEIRINGTSSQQGWNNLQYNQNFNQDVEASIRVKTPVIDENSGFSFIIQRGGPQWGYYRIQRHYWGYNVGGHFEGEEYWDSGVYSSLIGNEAENFHTYKIIYEQSKQNMSFYVDNLHLYTIEDVNFYDFRFEFGGGGWQPNQSMDFRIDNFTVKEIGDFDNDDVGDICDNCPYNYNPEQEDSDADGIGNICEPVKISGYVFNVNNNPLNVTVDLEDAAETIELLNTTDKNGYFEFSNVPKGYYELEANDDEPILWQYTGAGIGDDTPMLDANSDIQVNFTLWKVNLTFKTNTSEYHNGDIIKVNITVSNNEIYNITNWEIGVELYFENDTYWDDIDEDFYLVNVSSGKTKSFLLYPEIPEDNKYNRLYLESWIWTHKSKFKSSKGLLQGEMGQWQEREINVTTYDIDGDGIKDDVDNCPADYNPGQEDSDGDEIGDVCDNCVYDYNPEQEDSDQDGTGDICETVGLFGYVFDSVGNPLANIPVELGNDAEDIWLDATTNNSGYFEFEDLTKGFYELYINNEEVIDCSLRNNVTDCHNIANRIDCENSYAEYCGECDLSDEECDYFPCSWEDVGEGLCYYSCDQCAFGINQSILEDYTSIDFEDENMINLTEDLEINATLLKMDAELKLNSSVYENGDTIKANVTVTNKEKFNLTDWGAAFNIWSTGDEDEELYFNFTPTNLSAGETSSFIFSFVIPENISYSELNVIGAIAKFNFSVPSSLGNLTGLIYKIDEKEVHVNLNTLSGYVKNSSGNPIVNIPVKIGSQGGREICIGNKTNSQGYFEFLDLPQDLYKLYINNEQEIGCGIRNKVPSCQEISDKVVCEKKYAEYCSEPGYPYCDLPEGECGYFPCFWGDVGEGKEACYSSCEQYTSYGTYNISEDYTSIEFSDKNVLNLTSNLEINVTLLKIDAKLELNASYYNVNDSIKANVTVKNDEKIKLENWSIFLKLWFENYTDYDELYSNNITTNLSEGEIKSYIFTFKIPPNPYSQLDILGGIEKKDYIVVSSQKNLTSSMHKEDAKKIHERVNSKFMDIYNDYGIDTDNNSLYDYLVIEVGVSIAKAGNYRISGSLAGLGYNENYTYLDIGEHTVQLRYDGVQIYKSKIDGPYNLTSLFMLNETWNWLDYRDSPYNTSSYDHNQFQRPAAYFNNQISDYGVDTDGDGLYNYLIIGVGVNATKSGRYQISGEVKLPNNNNQYVYNITNLTLGVNTIQLVVDGNNLFVSHTNGLYKLLYINLQDENLNMLDSMHDVYNTSYYNYTQFQPPDAYFTHQFNDYGLDTDVNGLYDYLVIEAGVNATKEGYYDIIASLYLNGSYIEIAYGHNYTYLSKGVNTVLVPFAGPKIYRTTFNGTYKVSASIVSQRYLDNAEYNTSYYNYSQFDYAVFTRNFSDYGLDTNGDGLYDHLMIEVKVNVSRSGIYDVNGYIYGVGGYLTNIHNSTFLDAGAQTIKFPIDGKLIYQNKMNGSYILYDLYLSNTLWGETDRIYYAYNTTFYNYTQFQPPTTEFNNIYSDYGTDTDADGLYNYLTVEVGTLVRKPGKYGVIGYLYDKNNNYIQWEENFSYLANGTQKITLNFDGTNIYSRKAEGPYKLRYLYLYDENWTWLDYVDDAYNTSYYNYTQFQRPIVCIDNDEDGFNQNQTGCGIADCNDNNTNVNPGATEVCNGIDDDCVNGIDENPAANASCDDYIYCTIDSCVAGSCQNIVSNAFCNDGLFCNGPETCDAQLDCQPGTPVNCNDGQYCNGIETCNEAADSCEVGTEINCSANNLPEIDECEYDPDNNPFTWDYFAGFNSTCDEGLDECTSSTISPTHTCNMTECGAECENNNNCAPTDCDYLDDCVSGDYYDYDDVPNNCLSNCSCGGNACGTPTIYEGDARCSVTHYPDIIVEDISIRSDVCEGETIKINATIKNYGNYTHNGFYVKYYIDGQQLSTSYIASLDTNESVISSVSWTLTAGIHNITAYADYSNLILESAESNNNRTEEFSVSYPDFEVTNINYTPLISDGQSITINATITNKGSCSKRGFRVGYYINDIYVTNNYISELDAGESIIKGLNLLATPDNLNVTVQADYLNEIIELNETNNRLTETLPNIAYADLIVSSIVTPSIFNDGDKVTLTAYVANIGGTTLRDFYVRFEIDGNHIGSQIVSGLANGTSIVVNQDWTASSGSHNVTVIVDEYNSVSESNESNNQLSEILAAIPTPDLIITNITWIPETNIKDGDNLIINATIKNIGVGSTSRDFYIDFEIDSKSIGIQRLSGLTAGNSVIINQKWIAIGGQHSIRVVADSTNIVSESNESNNYLYVDNFEVPLPNLVITNISWSPSTISDGTEVIFNATIENMGADTSRSFGVSFKINDTSIDYVVVKGFNGSKNISSKREWTASPGFYSISAYIDLEDIIPETNELDNNLTKFITVTDQTSPSLLGISPSNGSIISEAHNITAELLDYSGVDTDNSRILIKQNGIEITGTKSAQNNSLIFIPFSPFGEGDYEVNITAVDHQANSGEIITTFVIDSSDPVIDIAGVIDDDYYETAVTPVITITDAHLNKSSIVMNGYSFASGTTITAEGEFLLEVWAVDEAGNYAMEIINFKIDTPPTKPTGLGKTIEGNDTILTWNANPEDDIAGYNVYRNNAKLNTELITSTTYIDSDINTSNAYLYQISAVDVGAHESELADTSPIYIRLMDYGTPVTYKTYLTRNSADSIKVGIENKGNDSVLISSVRLELIDMFGNVVSTKETSSLFIPAGETEVLEEYFMINQNFGSKLSVHVDLSDSNITSLYRLNVRDPPSSQISSPIINIWEGYPEEISFQFTNYGSVPLNVDPTEIIVYLKNSEEVTLSQGGGIGASQEVAANGIVNLSAIIYAPMAVPNNLSLGDIHLEVVLPSQFNDDGLKQGPEYQGILDASIIYQTIDPITVYYGPFVRGSTNEFTLSLNNKGSTYLNVVNNQNVHVYIKDLEGNMLSEGTGLYSGQVLAHSTSDFRVRVQIPLDAPDMIILEAEINATCINNICGVMPFKTSSYESVIAPDYNANATTDKDVYQRGENVTISGVATFSDGSPVPNATVKLTLYVKGFSHSIYINADSLGQYSYSFKPLATEAGKYTISATHPDITAHEDDANFEILGLYLSPKKIEFHMSQNSKGIVPLNIKNLGATKITGVSLEVIDLDANDSVTVSVPSESIDLDPGELKDIYMNVSAGFDPTKNKSFEIRATSNQGSLEIAALLVALHTAEPIASIQPGYIETGVKSGSITVKKVTITNLGYGLLKDVNIVRHSIPWISIISDTDLGDIYPGKNKTFDILINPDESIESGVYEDEFEITSSNYQTITFPIRVFLTLNETGDLRFIVKDDFGEALANANVQIRDKSTYTLNFKGQTDSNGEVLFSDIPKGMYQYRVDLEIYNSGIDDTFVESGIENTEEVTLSYAFIQIEWEVVETNIKDVYEIRHNITYETTAPVPYIKMDKLSLDLYMVPGETYRGEITLTNMNEVVSVLNLRPDAWVSSELVSVEFLVDSIPELKPMESITIPYVVKLAEHHSPEVTTCEKYHIAITIVSDLNCVNGVWVPSFTDIFSINIKALCVDAIWPTAQCLCDIFTGSLCTVISAVSDVSDIISTLSDPLGIKGCLDAATADPCVLWDAGEVADNILSCAGIEVPSCLSAAYGWAQCMLQDECCAKGGGDGGGGGGGCCGGPGWWGGYGWTYPTPWSVGECLSMCIKAKIEIEQEATLERQAFDATLKLTNPRTDYDLTNLSVKINIADSEGNPANNLFFIKVTDTKGINNIENDAIDGTIPPGKSIAVRWQFIPIPGAGGNTSDGETYSAEVDIDYSVKNLSFETKTWPDYITVKPMPILVLDYFLPRKVYGNDPFTIGIIEPSIPFMFGVRVNNSGYGPANNLAIDSAQPKIVEITPGANLEFKLLGTWISGTQADKSLKINFGDILPGGCVAAGWQMISSVTGNFMNYTASYTHSDTLGGEATSLIQGLNTHTLIHEMIKDIPGEDNMFDFLVDSDDDNIPDRIYDSRCNDGSIKHLSLEFTDAPTFENPTAKVKLNETVPGWIYIDGNDALNNENEIEKIIRSDGNVLNMFNYWLRDNKLHIVDYDTTGKYNITYSFLPRYVDLSLTGLEIFPEVPDEGDNLTITVTINRTGNLSVDVGRVNVSMNVTGFHDWIILNLTNKTSVDVNFTWTTVAGIHRIYAIVDSLDNILESNENNNQMTRLVVVLSECIDNDKDGFNQNQTACGIADCNDNDTNVNPGATEFCDGVDNNCNGQVDDGLTAPLNSNQYGVCVGSKRTCSGVNGWVDNYSAVPNYEAQETSCDGKDNNCDNLVDEGYLDSDGDGIADCIDPDDDNDGINDTNDNIIGNSSYIENNFDNLTFEVNGTIALSFNGTANVTFKDKDKTIVEFEFNFSAYVLDLTNITINKQEENATQGSIIVEGIDLTKQNKTKTVYVDHIDQNANSVCVKDSEIVSITEISENCTGVDEFIINCPGTNNGYSCYVENNRYKLSGLKHSGVKEFMHLIEFNISLNKGWNLISIPLEPKNNTVSRIFENINYSKVFSYNRTWLYYYNKTKNNFNTIDKTKGYWIKSLNNQTLTIEGIEFDSLEIPLEQGWNLIGYLYLNETDINNYYLRNYTTFAYINNSWSSYIPNRPFNSLTKMKPGFGYWVKPKI